MEWRSASDCPEPDPWFVRELKLIDPTLRVVWGLQRYVREEWAIERKYPAERYWLSHASLMEGGGDRFIDQPVFDDSQPIYDETGVQTGFKQVGTRKLDLAPEYEWMFFAPRLDQALITKLRKLYWEHDHPEEVAAGIQKQQEARATDTDRKVVDAIKEGREEAFLETRKVVQFGRGKKRNE